MSDTASIYGGLDPREVPAYTIADASRYLHVPAATLRSWFLGRTYAKQGGLAEFGRLISPAAHAGPHLSFLNLVEAHVLRSLRTNYRVSVSAVRTALETAERQLNVGRLLLSDQLLASAGELFIEHYGGLINLSRSGQYVMRRTLEAYLRRVEWDDSHIPLRLFPFLRSDMPDDRPIVIDPRKAFGQPTIVGSGVMTSILADRMDAGETVEELATDYGIPSEKIEAALLFEKAA